MGQKIASIKYFNSKAATPEILSPKNDNHWSSIFNPEFSWKHNGSDLQMEYKLQVFNIPFDVVWTDPSDRDIILFKNEWTTGTGNAAWYKLSSSDNAVDIINEAGNGDYGFIEFTGTSVNQNFTPASMTSFVTDLIGTALEISGESAGVGLVSDGAYIWRVQVRGFVSRGWSDWAYDGLLRVDRGTPEILNIASETAYKEFTSLSSISDFSIPHMYSEDSGGVRRLGTSDRKGMHIYYDYRDNSIILRTYSDPDDAKRFYGMISFHMEDVIEDLNDFVGYTGPEGKFLYPHEIIDSVYTYKIDRYTDGESWNGASEKVEFASLNSDGKLSRLRPMLNLGPNHDVLYGKTSDDKYNVIFKGIPNFPGLSGSIYDDIGKDIGGYQAFNDPLFTSITPFAFNTFLIPSNKKFQFKRHPVQTASPEEPVTIDYDDLGVFIDNKKVLLEMRYPAPFQDCFIVFSLGSDGKPTSILCTGQYKEWEDMINVSDNPLLEAGPFLLARGLDVEGNRLDRKDISDYVKTYYSIFEGNSSHIDGCPYTNNTGDFDDDWNAVDDRIGKTTMADVHDDITEPLVSPFMSFNLYPEAGKDTAIKIRLRPEAIRILEQSDEAYFTRGSDLSASDTALNSNNSDSSVGRLGFVEFHMYPDTDCSIATYSKYQEKIAVNDVMIGNSCISPRDLAVFRKEYGDTDSGKLFMRNLKTETVDTAMRNGDIRGIDDVKVFPVNDSDFSDGKVVFVNEPDFDVDDSDIVFGPFTVDTTADDQFIFDKYDAITPLPFAIGGSVSELYDFDIVDVNDVANFELALSQMYGGDDNVPLGDNTNVSWGVVTAGSDVIFLYPLFDIHIELLDINGLQVQPITGSEMILRLWRRFTDTNGVNTYRISISFEKFFEADTDLPDPSTLTIHNLKIRKEFGEIDTQFYPAAGNVNNPYHTLLLEVGELPLGDDGLPATITDDSFITMRQTTLGTQKFRIHDVILPTYGGVDTDLSTVMNDRSFVKILFYPFDWGSDYNLYVGQYPDQTPLVIEGSFIEVSFFNSDAIDKRKYNGSFQLLVPPKYDFVPYYHPNAVSNLESSGYGADPVVPNIVDAYSSAQGNDQTGWDSIYIDDSITETTDGKIKRGFLYPNDYVMFFAGATPFGQMAPYLYDPGKNESLSLPKGKFDMNKHGFLHVDGSLRGSYEFGNFGHAMYYNGFSNDGLVYNRTVSGLFGVAKIEHLTGQSRLALRDFSNLLFKKGTSFVFDGDIDGDTLRSGSTTLGSTDRFTFGISSSETGYTFGGRNTSVLDNGSNAWLYTTESDAISSSLIAFDRSSKGLYGENDVSERTWLELLGKEDPFGSHFIYWDNGSGSIHYEQMMRMVPEGSDESDATAVILRSVADTASISDGQAGMVTGDIFSLGNLFGYSYTVAEGGVRVFFDIEESLSGISEYRYFVQTVSTTDSTSTTHLDQNSSIRIGDEDFSGRAENKVKMQILNNSSKPANYVTTHRTNFADITSHLQGITTWSKFSNIVDPVLADGSGYGTTRMFADIAVSGSGYKMIYFQVKNKSGTLSNIYPLSINALISDEIKSDTVDLASLTFDNSEIFDYANFTKVDSSVSHVFTKNYLPSDESRSRTLVLKNILTLDDKTKPLEYVDYRDSNNLYAGFSDNFGLSYSVFSPFLSYNPWDISIPIDIPGKSFSSWARAAQPDWFFDPNHVRHYTVDSSSEMTLNIGASGRTPGNSGLTPITIVGLVEENHQTLPSPGKSNPVAKKIYENREEVIGKKLILGADLSLKFDIIHVFKSDNIVSVERDSGYIVDADSVNENGNFKDANTKVWIVIEDPLGTAAAILSRKFEESWEIGDSVIGKITDAVSGETSYGEIATLSFGNLAEYKLYTGWRKFASDERGVGNLSADDIKSSGSLSYDFFGNKTQYFGYTISDDIRDTVDLALDIDPDTGVIPSMSTGSFSEDDVLRTNLYIAPTLLTSKSSGLETQDGWITRIYKRFANENSRFDQMRHYNISGIEVLDRMVFGSEHKIVCTVLEREEFSESGVDKRIIYIQPGNLTRTHYEEDSGLITSSTVSIGTSRLDATMASPVSNNQGFAYEIVNVSGASDSIVESGFLHNVSDDGLAVILDIDETMGTGDFWNSGWGSLETVATDTYEIRVTISPLHSTDQSTQTIYESGWWPSVSGTLLSAGDMPMGAGSSATTMLNAKNLDFSIESCGAFYIDVEGDYRFKILSDGVDTDVDFTIDYMRSESTVAITGSVYDSVTSKFVEKNIGGLMNKTSEQTFYLKKGWHTGRLRYHSGASGYRFLTLLYRKPSWDAHYDDTAGNNEEWIPFMGSRNIHKTFLKKGFKTVSGKIITKDGDAYPPNNVDSNILLTERQSLKAIIGFGDVEAGQSISFKDSAAWVTKKSDNEAYGSVHLSKKGSGRVYSAQILEEATGVYVSNVYDGGNDLKFWRSIKWNPTTQVTPSAMDVEFYVRTAQTASELEDDVRKWNNIGTNETTGEIILPAFVDPNGNSLTNFSHPFNSVQLGDATPNRFLQFKMVLKSRVFDQSPKVTDVVIEYSKENSVNFFTTNFDLNSNILRAVLTYNGENELDVNGVAVSDIQIGMCTIEESDGQVSTNFDDYTIIPQNEVFSLHSLGIAKNDKFRIGIKFVSTTDQVPVVEEFGVMFETEKIDNSADGHFTHTKDL